MEDKTFTTIIYVTLKDNICKPLEKNFKTKTSTGKIFLLTSEFNLLTP